MRTAAQVPRHPGARGALPDPGGLAARSALEQGGHGAAQGGRLRRETSRRFHAFCHGFELFWVFFHVLLGLFDGLESS